MGAYGAFRVDPQAGLIYGKRGKPVGSLDSSGYVQICVIVGSKKTLRSAHRWIWEHVHGAIPPGLQINHRNGIKTDNRIANLELLTQQANIQHAYRTGITSNAGEQHPQAKLTEAKVRAIRAAAAAGVPHLRIATEHGIARRTVNDIARRKAWPHVKD